MPQYFTFISLECSDIQKQDNYHKSKNISIWFATKYLALSLRPCLPLVGTDVFIECVNEHRFSISEAI